MQSPVLSQEPFDARFRRWKSVLAPLLGLLSLRCVYAGSNESSCAWLKSNVLFGEQSSLIRIDAADASDVLSELGRLEKEQYDVVVLDGKHDPETVQHIMERSVELLRKDGLLCVCGVEGRYNVLSDSKASLRALEYAESTTGVLDRIELPVDLWLRKEVDSSISN